MKSISLRAYARHRQVTLRAVQKAIESGRIQTILDDKGKIKIDQDDADQKWQERTNPAKQQLTPPAPVALPVSVPAELIESEADDGQSDDPDDDGPDGELDYFKARAKREVYQAKISKLNYRERAGELVEASQIKSEWQKLITTSKTRLLSVPSKARARIPHLTASDAAIIEEEIREALEELAAKGSE